MYMKNGIEWSPLILEYLRGALVEEEHHLRKIRLLYFWDENYCVVWNRKFGDFCVCVISLVCSFSIFDRLNKVIFL